MDDLKLFSVRNTAEQILNLSQTFSGVNADRLTKTQIEQSENMRHFVG